MFKARFVSVLSLLAVGAVSSHATWYTDENAFKAAIDPAYYLEDFNGFHPGGITGGIGSTFTGGPVNGFSWTASTTDAGGLTALSTGALSTVNRAKVIDWSLSSNITAFGGFFFTTGGTNPGEVLLTVGGEQHSVFTGFLGWVGTASLSGGTTKLTGAQNVLDHVTVDHIYAGKVPAAVPEPFTMSLGLASVGLFVRRRLKKG